MASSYSLDLRARVIGAWQRGEGSRPQLAARFQARRQAVQAEIAQVAPADLIFIDESAVNRAMTRTHARSLRGTRAYGSAPRHRWDSVSTLGALSLRGTLEPMCIDGSTTGPGFLAFLKPFPVPHLWPGAVVVMDNLGAPKVKGGRDQRQLFRTVSPLP